MVIEKPMAAAKLRTIEDLRLPCMLTPKFDGVRCLIIDGVPMSRAFKPIRNMHIARMLSTLPSNLDGELMSGHFNEAQSNIMRYDGTPEFTYFVFDYVPVSLEEPYYLRVEHLKSLDLPNYVKPVLPTLVSTVEEFLEYERACLAMGYEGVMGRCAHSPYKSGRSTLNEYYLFKFKRYEDAEAIIVGFVEARENTNPIVRDVFGRAKRPGSRANKVPRGTLGALQVRDCLTGTLFEIGTGKGLTQALRQRIWDNQAQYLGQTVTYTYQDVGSKDRPRFPSFQGFRYDIGT